MGTVWTGNPILSQAPLVELAKQTARRHALDPAVVCAVCEEESGRRDNVGGMETWDVWSTRFEPAFEARYIHPAVMGKPTTEELLRAVSFGLMQIMGEVAREFGYNGRFLSSLCDPATGLEYGCRKLRRCFDEANGDLRAALLIWNGGGDPDYPARVSNRIAKYQ